MRIHPLAPYAVLAAALAAAPAHVAAHFKMLEPASWIVESERATPRSRRPGA